MKRTRTLKVVAGHTPQQYIDTALFGQMNIQVELAQLVRAPGVDISIGIYNDESIRVSFDEDLLELRPSDPVRALGASLRSLQPVARKKQDFKQTKPSDPVDPESCERSMKSRLVCPLHLQAKAEYQKPSPGANIWRSDDAAGTAVLAMLVQRKVCRPSLGGESLVQTVAIRFRSWYMYILRGDQMLSQPPASITESSLRAVNVGIPWLSHNFRKSSNLLGCIYCRRPRLQHLL